MDASDRFELWVCGHGTRAPREVLGPAGALVLVDLYPLVAGTNGRIIALPTDVCSIDPRDIVPAFAHCGEGADLRAYLASLTEPCSTRSQDGRLLIWPSAERPHVDLVC